VDTTRLTPSGQLTAEDLGTVHLIGIGGVGMSGLARLLLTRGIPVTGSELRDWPALAGLRALGGTVHMHHRPSNVDGVDTVVYSSAIAPDHLELVEAQRRGLRILHRSEALAAAMTGRRTIAVAGTHGKTTTTSMVTLLLQHAGLDPSFVIGGEISEVGSNAHHGSGEFFVAEADESDRSFLLYRPYVAILTNIDADHLNTYGDLAGLQAAFEEFARLTDAAGFVVACADDPRTRQLAGALRDEGRAVYTYGEAPDADLRISEVSSSVTGVCYLAALDGRPLGEVALPVPGRHLGLNSAAAVLTALRLGLSLDSVTEALAAFPGVRRRFELKGVADGVRVYDEYAYHPTSMTAALRTLREVAGQGRLVVAFQPYRVYRTRDLQSEIAAALGIADEVVVMEVFGPGEVREPGQGGVALTAAVPLPEAQKAFVPSWEDVPGEVVRRARQGDVVVTMGAPPISLMGDELLSALAERAAPRPTGPAPARHPGPAPAGPQPLDPGPGAPQAAARAVPGAAARAPRPGPAQPGPALPAPRADYVARHARSDPPDDRAEPPREPGQRAPVPGGR
jgi:UDP-N-acetylmuramate--alanine ligase